MNLTSKYDDIIEDMINDPKYVILENGKILSFVQRNGKIGKSLREIDSLDKDGYIRVKYKGRRFFAHRVVYRKFNGQLKESMVVDHIDRDRRNNDFRNLALVTPSDNTYLGIMRKRAK